MKSVTSIFGYCNYVCRISMSHWGHLCAWHFCVLLWTKPQDLSGRMEDTTSLGHLAVITASGNMIGTQDWSYLESSRWVKPCMPGELNEFLLLWSIFLRLGPLAAQSLFRLTWIFHHLSPSFPFHYIFFFNRGWKEVNPLALLCSNIFGYKICKWTRDWIHFLLRWTEREKNPRTRVRIKHQFSLSDYLCGLRSVYCPWVCQESDMTEQLTHTCAVVSDSLRCCGL